MPPEIPFRVALVVVIVLTMAVTVYHRLQAAKSGETISRKEERLYSKDQCKCHEKKMAAVHEAAPRVIGRSCTWVKAVAASRHPQWLCRCRPDSDL